MKGYDAIGALRWEMGIGPAFEVEAAVVTERGDVRRSVKRTPHCTLMANPGLRLSKFAHDAKVTVMRITFRHFKPDAVSFRLTVLVRLKCVQHCRTIDAGGWCKQDDEEIPHG